MAELSARTNSWNRFFRVFVNVLDMWSLKKLLDTRLLGPGRTIIDKTDIITYLAKNSSNGKLLGLFCNKAPAMMYVSVEQINYNNDDEKNPMIVFDWFEPTGELLSNFTIGLDDILAICPFDEEKWSMTDMIDRCLKIRIGFRTPAALFPA
jgi:hypothetical protein